MPKQLQINRKENNINTSKYNGQMIATETKTTNARAYTEIYEIYEIYEIVKSHQGSTQSRKE